MSRPATGLILPNLLSTCRAALDAADVLRDAAKTAVAALVAPDGKIDAGLLEREQFAAHGFAWLATYVTALRELLHWAERLEAEGALGELEILILQAAFGEYLQQLCGGIALSQVEIFRPGDLGVDSAPLDRPAVARLTAGGNTAAVRQRIAALIREGAESKDFGDPGLDDEMLEMVRDQFRKVADDHSDAAHRWHLADDFIPMEVVEELAELGAMPIFEAKQMIVEMAGSDFDPVVVDAFVTVFNRGEMEIPEVMV